MFSKCSPTGVSTPFLSCLLTVIEAPSLYSGMPNSIFSLLKLGIPNVPMNSVMGVLKAASTTTDLSSANPAMSVPLSVPVILTKSIKPKSKVCSTKSNRLSLIYFPQVNGYSIYYI